MGTLWKTLLLSCVFAAGSASARCIEHYSLLQSGRGLKVPPSLVLIPSFRATVCAARLGTALQATRPSGEILDTNERPRTHVGAEVRTAAAMPRLGTTLQANASTASHPLLILRRPAPIKSDTGMGNDTRTDPNESFLLMANRDIDLLTRLPPKDLFTGALAGTASFIAVYLFHAHPDSTLAHVGLTPKLGGLQITWSQAL